MYGEIILQCNSLFLVKLLNLSFYKFHFLVVLFNINLIQKYFISKISYKAWFCFPGDTFSQLGEPVVA